MRHILISGSLAYDYIMDFPDSFKHHILADQIHILNVCFNVRELKKNFGGTAGNMAYTMKLLGADPLILAPLGQDGREYLDYLQTQKINTNYIPLSPDKLTSSAHITTDKDNNQITAFYAGALAEATALRVADIKEKITLGIIGPTQKEAMIQHALECYHAHLPFVFDPGQQITSFSDQELMTLVGQASFFIANDYEMKLLQNKTGWSPDELLGNVAVVITTLGEKGSIIKTKDQTWTIFPCSPLSIEDPTGAGDAYRAGFFTAYVTGHDYQTCGQVGSVAASYAIEHYGTQNHRFTLKEFKKRYLITYGKKI